MMTVKKRLFQQSSGCNSKINDWIWPVFKLIRDFIHVHFICIFQADPIKTKQVTLMTTPNRGFFSNQGNVTLRLISDLVSFQTCPRFNSCLHYLQVSGTFDKNWRSYDNEKHFTIVSLRNLVVALATKVFIGFPSKASTINAPPEACYRLEMMWRYNWSKVLTVGGRRMDGRTTDGRTTDGRTDGRRTDHNPFSSQVS